MSTLRFSSRFPLRGGRCCRAAGRGPAGRCPDVDCAWTWWRARRPSRTLRTSNWSWASRESISSTAVKIKDRLYCCCCYKTTSKIWTFMIFFFFSSQNCFKHHFSNINNTWHDSSSTVEDEWFILWSKCVSVAPLSLATLSNVRARHTDLHSESTNNTIHMSIHTQVCPAPAL